MCLDRERDVALQRARNRAVLLGPGSELVEPGLVDPGHAAAYLQRARGDRPLAVDPIEGNLAGDFEALGRESGLRQVTRECHREATRVRARDELLRAGSPVRV